MDNSSHGGIETVIAELDATINCLSRQPETDKAATAAMISATTARATLRDLLRSREGAKSNDVKLLQGAVHFMDALAQEGFSEISAIAKLALAALETPDGYRDTETIARALRAIWYKADDIENCINHQAEEVGCNYRDPNAERRYAAHRAALDVNQAVEVSHV